MPGRDGTGPNNEGPMTGQKLGPCNKDQKSEPIDFGRCGQRRGCNKSFGRGQGFNQPQNKQAKE
jgi:hypothetical protein